MRKNC